MTDGSPRESVAGRLVRLGFAEPDAATQVIDAMGLPQAWVTTFAATSADPDLAVRSLGRLVAAADHLAPSEGARLREALASPPDDDVDAPTPLIERLLRVLGASATLGDYFARHPADWLALADPDLELVRPTSASLAETLGSATSPDALRVTYRRLLSRLAARDLSQQLHVADVAGELADLATGAIDAALRLAVGQARVDPESFRLAVVGLGKCGARELNYVSDVDVLFVAEPASGRDEAAALHAATLVASTMMRICSDHTPEGTLWPVDAGLRPEGHSGPLVRTLASHRAYYGKWAKTWEFQAMLKARAIAGDLALGRAFVGSVEPLVWSAAERPHFVGDVQAMRRRVVELLPADSAERELKLGPGGLRDIEFAVQLLQLVHGRADASLRDPNTWNALDALTEGGYIGRPDGAALREAYSFLRSVEHRLQLSHLRRTHTLPTNTAELRALGRSLGRFGDPVAELDAQWRRHAVEVRRLHEKLFYRPLLSAVAAVPGEQARLTTSAARDRLSALGYQDGDAALRHLEALSAGVSRRAAIQRALLPVMLGWFADGPDPDLGLLSFRQLSDALGSSPWYLRMLRDESAAAERLAKMLSTSRFVTDLLMRAPEATSLLHDDAELVPPAVEVLIAEAETLGARQSGPAASVEAVRGLRRRELLRVAVADLLGLLGVERVGESLSAVTRATVQATLDAATRAYPGGADVVPRLSVIAMGRLGGREMSYGSDADVLFVYEAMPGQDERAAFDAAAEIAAQTRALLAAPGPDPALPVDADLRPEGRQGALVRSLASYQAYYARWSHAWEAQALLRASELAGDHDLAGRFLAMVDPMRFPPGGISGADLAEIRRIKARVQSERLPRGVDPNRHVKLGPGGLADIEWTVQLLQLRHAHAVPGLRTTQTLHALAAARGAGLVDSSQADALAQAWRWATRLRNASALVRGRQSDLLPTPGREQAGVAWVCGYGRAGLGTLLDDYRRAARRAAQAVEDVFWS